jgi:anti-sigma-K factor RskA
MSDFNRTPERGHERREVEELIAAYALDALDPDERARVESLVDGDAELRSELDAFRTVTAMLAEAVEPAPSTPSPAVWERISAEIEGRQGDAAPGLASVAELRRQRRWSRFAATVSIAAVAVSIVLGVRLIDLQRDIDDQDLSALATAKVTEAGAEVVDLAGVEGHEGQGARIVLGDDGLGYVLSNTLTPLGDDRTYQLWAIVPGEDEPRVISAGVLGNAPGVSQFQVVGDVAGFAITEEIAGGVVVSEGGTVSLWLRDGA